MALITHTKKMMLLKQQSLWDMYIDKFFWLFQCVQLENWSVSEICMLKNDSELNVNKTVI